MKKLLMIGAVCFIGSLSMIANAIPGHWGSPQASYSPVSGLEYTITQIHCRPNTNTASCVTENELQTLANEHSHSSPTQMTVGGVCPVMGNHVKSWTYGYDSATSTFKQWYWDQVCGF